MRYTVHYEKNSFSLIEQSGKTIDLGLEAGIATDIHWSPASQAFVGVVPAGPIAAGPDSKEIIRYQDTSKSYYFPALPFAKNRDNIRFIGWARDGKSFYVADLAPIPYDSF